MLRRFLERNTFVSVSIGLFIVILLLTHAPIRYEINDDIIIKNILSGQDRSPADFSSTTHVVSQILSYLLYHLYSKFPSVPWFQLTIYLEAYLGIVITLSVLLKRTLCRKSVLYPILLVPSLVVFFLSCLTHITFTSAALFLEFGALFALFEWMTRKGPQPESRPVGGYLPALCLVMSFFLRWHGFFSSLLFGAPILLFARKHHVKMLLLLVFVLLIAFSADKTISFMNDTPHHREFLKFNKVRSSFQDYIGGEYFEGTTEKAAHDAGWSINDYWFFRMWTIYDDKLFSAEKVGIFLKENSPTGTMLPEIILERIIASATENKHYVLLFVFTFLSLVCYGLRPFLSLERKEKATILLSMGFMVLGIIFLMYYRFPSRIYIPLFVFILGTAFIFFDIKAVTRPQNALLTAAGLVFLVLAVVEGYTQSKTNLQSLQYTQVENSYVRSCLEQVRSRYGDPLLLQLLPTASHGLGIERIHPFRPSTDFTLDNRIFYNPVNSPRYYAQLEQYGIKDGNAFLKWTINNERVLFVFFDEGGQVGELVRKLWELYYDKHISPDHHVSLEKVADFRQSSGIGFVFYRMIAR